MKTTKITSVLSFALIFACITTGFATGSETRNSQFTLAKGVTYHVTIHLPGFTKNICNPYLVEILDETGRLVAPAQVFIAEESKYVFKEMTTAPGKARMAVLVPVEYPQHFVCPNDLYTIPDVETGPFLSGCTYSFDLYPGILTPNAN